jgi:sortase A
MHAGRHNTQIYQARRSTPTPVQKHVARPLHNSAPKVNFKVQAPVPLVEPPVFRSRTRQKSNRPQVNPVVEQPAILPKHPRISLRTVFRRYTAPQLAMMSAACLVFLLGLSVSIFGVRTNLHVQAQANNLTSQANSDGDHPNETDPGSNAVNSYRTPFDEPRRITIPRLGINARVKPLDLKANNVLDAPASIYDAGWYEHSAKPGENGATLIDGHVHGLTKRGIFYNLKKLDVGDEIEIERGDGKIFKYSVIRKQSYDRNAMDMASALVSIDPSLPGLNLITCDGPLDKKNNTYEDRLLIQAVLVD